jgi:aminoglycoside phosphotransferase (APT) family kinase protein
MAYTGDFVLILNNKGSGQLKFNQSVNPLPSSKKTGTYPNFREFNPSPNVKIDCMDTFDFSSPNQKEILQAYVSRSLGETVQLVSVEQFAASTRSAPWHVIVESRSSQQHFVLRLGADFTSHEIGVLQAMARIPEIPTPKVYDWEPDGRTFGAPCFLSDFVNGVSLLQPMLAGEKCAEDLYLRTVLELNALSRERLQELGCRLPEGETVLDQLENAQQFFVKHPSALTDKVYEQLSSQPPDFPELCFSNGDLWLDNILVKDRKLIGVIDFEQAGFSDPIYEFLLPFFNEPRLRGRGIEERYCALLGVDPASLRWYHGLEYFDTLYYVEKSGKAFNQYSSGRLREELEQWLNH